MVEASLLDERTADLQRLQAEYANYRKRTAAEAAAGERRGTERLLGSLLPVIDDLDRAREHDDYTGPLQVIGDKLIHALKMAGLEEFGYEGDVFDPAKHEAVMHDERADIDVPTATKVLRRGYMCGEKLLRPAMVGVSDPARTAHEPTSDTNGSAPDDESDTQSE
jgi:molecular chaperone GrpE